MSRGTPSNPNRFKQSIRFDGLVYGTISPTDIDGFLDFNKQLFVLIEAKMCGAPFAGGQRLSFERLARESRVPSVYLFVTHSVPTTEDVYLAQCDVVKVYRAPLWTWQEQTRPYLTTQQKIADLRVEFGLESVRPKVFTRTVTPLETPTAVEWPKVEPLAATDIRW